MPASCRFRDGVSKITLTTLAAAHGGLVEQHHRRLGHERPAHCEHLLLPPLRVPATCLSDAPSRRNARTLADAGLDVRLFRERIAAHPEVLLNGEPGEGPATLGDLDDAHGHDVVLGWTFVSSWPLRRTEPWRGRTIPLIVLSVVLLPAPLAPMSATIALLDRERDPAQSVDVAV